MYYTLEFFFFFFFFFSSRRRHTRSLRDWSSDVCSSDLGIPLTDDDRLPWLRSIRGAMLQWQAQGENAVIACSALKRSEERRVGKEGRSRGGPYHEKEKTVDKVEGVLLESR